MSEEILCPCGKPLHYAHEETRAYMERIVRELGELQPVTDLATGRQWLVPRHYTALHGIQRGRLAEIAMQYGFVEVQDYKI